ncbi:hypothetical protein H696_04208 [Fonticula alba]|uniref:Uncharacterized protein n=1 Tax=Fonticula alba TaxID=691883 RepID=A0A058Z3B3_FONAL|nr:hypothetical protein H696_04208 [Fonticula alba]KCV68789.1 hypothetical protein H696_04208 [Fonticula alba]|eukprot:XP_009496360.1 hypothetical protein H696_04208 [Fonticula alba]
MSDPLAQTRDISRHESVRLKQQLSTAQRQLRAQKTSLSSERTLFQAERQKLQRVIDAANGRIAGLERLNKFYFDRLRELRREGWAPLVPDESAPAAQDAPVDGATAPGGSSSAPAVPTTTAPVEEADDEDDDEVILLSDDDEDDADNEPQEAHDSASEDMSEYSVFGPGPSGQLDSDGWLSEGPPHEVESEPDLSSRRTAITEAAAQIRQRYPELFQLGPSETNAPLVRRTLDTFLDRDEELPPRIGEAVTFLVETLEQTRDDMLFLRGQAQRFLVDQEMVFAARLEVARAEAAAQALTQSTRDRQRVASLGLATPSPPPADPATNALRP